jgi:hypothetical protein
MAATTGAVPLQSGSSDRPCGSSDKTQSLANVVDGSIAVSMIQLRPSEFTKSAYNCCSVMTCEGQANLGLRHSIRNRAHGHLGDDFFATDTGTIETPTPASTRQMRVGISPAVWTTLGTTPALLRIPAKRSRKPGAYSRAYMTNGFPLSSRRRISFFAESECHEGKIATNGSR